MEKAKLKGIVFAALFAALTAAVAWFKIPLPFTPVPITLQTLVVLLSGVMLGPYYGALSMIIYIVVGALGLPVFAGGASGIGVLLGPTGGYLFSYPLAAYVVGLMTSKDIKKLFSKYIALIIFIISIVLFVIGYLLTFFIRAEASDAFFGFVLLHPTPYFYMLGIYLFIYSILVFLFGKILEGKKALSPFLKYFSFIVVVLLVVIVLLDSVLKIGIMKLGDKVMVSILSEQQRMVLIIVSIVMILSLLLLVLYFEKSKAFSIDTILAMFAGTLIIYILGSIQGKLVTELQWSAIFVGWVLPFIVGDTIKLLLAAYIAKNVDIRKYMK